MYQVDLQHSVNTGYIQPYQIYDQVNQVCKKDLTLMIDSMIDRADIFDYHCLDELQSIQLTKLLNDKRRLIKSTLRFQINKGFKDFKTGHRLKLREHRSLKELSNELGKYATRNSISLLHHSIQFYNSNYADFLAEQLKCFRTLVHRGHADKAENPIGIYAIFHYYETSIVDLGLKPDRTEAVLRLFQATVLPILGTFYQKIQAIFIEQNLTNEAQFDRHKQENEIVSESEPADKKSFERNSVNLVKIGMMKQSHHNKEKQSQATEDKNHSVELFDNPVFKSFLSKTNRHEDYFNEFQNLKYQLIESGITQFSDHCDILSMMFDLIFEDSNTPNKIKQQISRMQYLYFISAINDKEYFLNSDHPGRTYLDKIQENESQWKGNPEYTARSAMFIGKQISLVIDQLPAQKIDFKQLLNQYLVSCKQFEKHPEIPELSAEEIANKKVAREKIQREVQELLTPLKSELKNINAIRPIFDRVIEPMLLGIANQNRIGSIPWHQSFNIAQTLVWTLTPKSSTVENQTMASTFFSLLSYLTKAMNVLNLSKQEKDNIIQILSTEHSRVVEQTEKNILHYAVKKSSKNTPQARASSNFQIDNVFLHDLKTHRDSTPKTQQGIKVAASIEIGDWVEIKPKGGKTITAKLTWKAADNSSFIFVDRLGNKVKELNLKSLASEIDSGQIKTIRQKTSRKSIM